MSVFEAEKKRAMERLQVGGADEEVAGIIERINSVEGFFTTSSCSGRIALICLPEIGAKREAEFIGKWHRLVTTEEVLGAIKTTEKGEIWLLSKANFMLERGKEKLKRFCYGLEEFE